MFSTADEVLDASSRTRTSSSSTSGSATCPASCSTSTCRPQTVDEDFFTERPDVRRLLDPRLPGHPRVRHEADPGPDDAPTSTRSAPRRRSIMNFSIVDPFTDEPYSRDPRNIAAKAEAYLKSTGIADTAYFGAEAEFYVFDDVRFETKQNAGYYYIDSDRGGLEHRPRRGGRQPRATRPATRAATSPSRRSTTSPTLRDQMLPRARRGRPRGRAQPPRGRHRRPAGDQLPLRHAAAVRRRHDEVQVRRQERRVGSRARPRPSCRSRSSATTARACTPTSRCGRTASRSSTTSAATAACPTWPAGTSAACSSTPRRCWPSPTRR